VWPALVAGATMAMCVVGIAVDGFDREPAPQAPVLTQSAVDWTIATHTRRIKRVLGGSYTREPAIGRMICPGRVISLDRRAGRAGQFSLAIAREDRVPAIARLRDALRADGWIVEYPVDGPAGRVDMLDAHNSEGYRVRIDVARHEDMAVRVESPCFSEI
jgi:hypothetical protein